MPVNRSISVSVGSGEVIATVTNSVPANLVWDSTSNSTWDIVTTPNWLNTGTSANDRFYQGDNVTFNDSVAGVQTNINVSAAVSRLPLPLIPRQTITPSAAPGKSRAAPPSM